MTMPYWPQYVRYRDALAAGDEPRARELFQKIPPDKREGLPSTREGMDALLCEYVRTKLRQEQALASLQRIYQKPCADFAVATPPLSYDTSDAKVGIAHEQGRRPTMEDAHLVTSFSLATREMVDLYAIFDGHRGRDAAVFAEEHLATYLQRALSRYTAAGDDSDVRIFAALKEAFAELDAAYQGTAGSTLNVVIRLGEALWICNVGDTRALLVQEGQILQLSRDQRPDDPDIRKGIEKRGGFVGCVYGVDRIGGILSVGRALGDHAIAGIVHTPKITKISLKDLKARAYLVIACDGIFDVCSTTQAGVFLRECMARHYSCQRMAEALTQTAWAAGSKDNLSTLVVRLT